MDPQGVYWIKQFVWLFLLPPNGLLMLALIGAVMAGWSARHYRLGALTSVISLVLFYLLMTPAVSQRLMTEVEYGVGDMLDEPAARALMASDRPPQAIVILGGGSHFDMRERPRPEVPSGNTQNRIIHGAQLARWTSLPVLTSGGQPSGLATSEATIMARALFDRYGVRARWIEGQSLDTTGNAQLSAPILQGAAVSRILLVTEAFHMRRARAEFERAGLEVIPAPHAWLAGRGAPPPSTWMPLPDSVARSVLAMHEMVGYGWFLLRGVMDRFESQSR